MQAHGGTDRVGNQQPPAVPTPQPHTPVPHLCRQLLQGQPLGGLQLASQLGHQGSILCSSTPASEGEPGVGADVQGLGCTG
jgi:hypothetical protein